MSELIDKTKQARETSKFYDSFTTHQKLLIHKDKYIPYKEVLIKNSQDLNSVKNLRFEIGKIKDQYNTS